MSYDLVFHKATDQDISEAVQWYNEKQPGLGDRFLHHLGGTLDNFSRTPHMWSIRYDEVRCVKIKDFPFLIHFIIEEKKKRIVVLGVIHTSRDPKGWKERRK